MRALLVLVLLTLTGSSAQAHNFAVSVLSVRQVAEGQFMTHWERLDGVRDQGTAYLLLRPQFPEHCAFEPPRLACGHSGLNGRMGFRGLGDVSTSALIRVQWESFASESFSFSAEEPHVLVQDPRRSGANSWTRLARSFVWIGVEHIWFGWDHLLFVLGLLWLARTPRALLQTITSFTIAHSLTLTAATFGYRSLPIPPVEAVIALSIVFVAVEVVQQRRTGHLGLTGRAPWFVAFGFGLLHGFGFASALSEIALPQADLPVALLFFNLGVELGQLVFVAVIWSLRWACARWAPRAVNKWSSLMAQYAMGTAGMYWVIERVLSFFDAS